MLALARLAQYITIYETSPLARNKNIEFETTGER